jgi:DNA-binding LytR/AlgR family response regulator
MAVHGQRYLADRTLAELEGSLNAREFIRDNRPFLVRISAIVPFRAFEKGKVRLELSPPTKTQGVVRQENAAAFEAWMGK